MTTFNNLRVDRDERNVVTVTFDVADRPVNVFDENLLRELGTVVDELTNDASARLILFRSGKDSGFLAGADVHRIRQINSAAEAGSVLKLGQELFNRVEALPAPTVAVIHGPCLGGGLEFALACTFRIARDDSATRLGLPETQLGLIPGWGGTQRLPRQVGMTAAARMILEGSHLTTAKARRIGLIDAALNAATFDADVATFIDERVSMVSGPSSVDTSDSRHAASQRTTDNGQRTPSPGWLAHLRDDTSLGQKLVLWFARRQIRSKVHHYPALPAALRAIEAGLAKGMETGLAREREEFCRVLFTPACRNLLDLFLQREAARKRSTWVGDDVSTVRRIESIAVLGAGTMGAGIAQLAATQGYSVVLKDVDDAAVQQGMRRIEQLTRQAVTKGALGSADAERALASITLTTEMEPLRNAELVIEAIVERLDVKQQVLRELDERLPADVVFASNTSALPISEMASVTSRTDRVAGLHFFNPVHKMPLVEVVRCPQTSEVTIAALVDVVRRLGKTPVVVAEGPGFLVNRILFPYLDEAVRMVCEGLAVDMIDREAKQFGLPMGPLELLDTVGLDVAADVSRTLAGLSLEESPTPQLLSEWVAAGHKGQKSGQGFYVYKDGRRGRPVTRGGSKGPYDDTGAASTLPPEGDFAGETLNGIQQRLAFSLINAAADVLHDQIVSAPWMVDLGMVLGTGFAPFRGGPLKLVESWGREPVVETLHQLSELCGPRFRPSAHFEEPRTTQHPRESVEVSR